MKILIDSSTLYSAISHHGKVREMLRALIEKHQIVTTLYIKEEVKRNFERAFSGEKKEEILKELEIFISECEMKAKRDYLEYLEEAREKISDKDAPVLACGMLPDIDCLITSDKEFWEIKSDKVTILSPKTARKKFFDRFPKDV